MKSALQLLTQRTLNCSRRIAFLGDMLELGGNEIMLHQDIISWPELADVDIVHTFGPLMYHLHKKLPSKIKGCHYESKNELISDLENKLQEGDKVLVKSSKSVGLSSIVDAIRAMKK
jgi:UDP-N-acetylmuramoyl-tripeptide--D-alanyl-D-alanine ligase